MDLHHIQQPIQPLLALFADVREKYLTTQVPLLDDVNKYVAMRSGKQLRPLLVMLCDGGRQPRRAAHLAVAEELLHNASLMHDDVVDESPIRRNQESVRQHWSNQVAVLTGDFYLAQVMRILFDLDDTAATRIVADTVALMCEGELLQQQYHGLHDRDRQHYLDVIFKKTGALMMACCQLGDADLKEFGRHFGTAFQLRDDIMDYGEDGGEGTPEMEVLREMLHEQVCLALSELERRPRTDYIGSLRELTEALLATEE